MGNCGKGKNHSTTLSQEIELSDSLLDGHSCYQRQLSGQFLPFQVFASRAQLSGRPTLPVTLG